MSRREEYGVAGKITFNNDQFELVPKGNDAVTLIDKLDDKKHSLSAVKIKSQFKQKNVLIEKNKILQSKSRLSLKCNFWESASGHAESGSGSILISEKPGIITLHEYDSEATFIGNKRNRYDSINYDMTIDDFIRFMKKNGNLE